VADRFVYLRLLRASLVLGALYDVLFALAMVFAPQVPARLLDLPLPGEPFYLWVLAVLLIMVATLYVVAAQDPRRYSAVVVVAIVGRLAGAAVFALAALGKPQLHGLWACAAGDAFFGVAHALCWARQR
jgi:hypothetical protein